MKSIKSFLYIDEYKMYSISSQIFEGLTEYILKSESSNTQEKAEQKGPFASGKVMADIISVQQNQTERRFLHDYAFNLFENKLNDMGKVLHISTDNINGFTEEIHEASFVKVKGRAAFVDTKAVQELAGNIRELYYSMKYIEKGGNQVSNLKNDLHKSSKNINDGNKKSIIKALIDKKLDAELIKLEFNLTEEFVYHLEYIISEMYKNQLLLQIVLNDGFVNNLFSSTLNRSNLTEGIDAIIHKYSRETEREMTLFGIVTQSGKQNDGILGFAGEEVDSDTKPGMRKAIMNMVNLMSGVDKTLIGRLDNEIVIDPIAVYYEI